MHVIHTLAELDAKIVEANRLEAISDGAMREHLGSFRMELSQELPPDPLSPAYRERQLALYRELTGSDYSTDKEITNFDVDAAVRRPFPFYTGSSATAGDYFMTIGFLLKSMALPPASRILEFGPGWGFTALWLALLGHMVTVVDIEPCFCELVQRRAAQHDVAINVVNADFFWVEGCKQQYDAVLFNSCFHHCDDHVRLLRALVPVVARNGRVFFGDEPISSDFPVPWGLRLDGCSLWGVRKNGWMELGFRDDYFARALGHTGWFGRRIAIADIDRLCVWEARHLAEAVFRYPATDTSLHTHAGLRLDGNIVVDNASSGTALFGPYVDLPAGRYSASIHLAAGTTIHGTAHMDVVCDRAGRTLAAQRIVAGGREGRAGPIQLAFASEVEMRGVEIRLTCVEAFKVSIAEVEIVPILDGPQSTGWLTRLWPPREK